MIVGESDPALRRTYFVVRNLDGELADAATGAAAGDVKATSNGTAFANHDVALFVHVGAGLHYIEATEPQAAIPGFLWFKLERAGFLRADPWTVVGQIFGLGETDPTLLRLPFTIYNTDGDPTEDDCSDDSITLDPPTTTKSLNGAAFGAAAGSVEFISDAVHYYQGVAADAAVAGLLSVKVVPDGDNGVAIAYTPVAAEGGAVTAQLTAISPDVGSSLEVDEQLVLEMAEDVETIDSIRIRYVGGGAFVEIYDGVDFDADFAASSVDIVDGVATITLERDGGWIVGVAEVEATANGDEVDAIGSWFLDAASVAAAAEPTPVPVEITEVSDVDEQDHVAIGLARLPVQFRGLI